MAEPVSYRLLLEQCLKEWQVDRRQRRALLALDPEHWPELLALADKLEVLLPHNALMAALWPTTRNPTFDDLSPVDYICTHGADGLREVMAFVHNDLG